MLIGSFRPAFASRIPRCLVTVAVLAFCGTVPGQGFQVPDEDEVETVFTHRYEVGLNLHTRGMGAMLQRGRYRGVGKVSTWSLELNTMKHAKEVRSFNPVYEQAKSYVFGKVNSLYIVRLGWGKRTISTPKLRNGGVSVGWHFAIGPEVGLTKPVYLEIGYPNIPYRYLLTERYDPDVHGTDDIYGRAGALNGILELTPHLGGFVRAACDFEYGGTREVLRTLSLGAQLDAFPNRITIMADDFNQNNRLFFTLFAHWTMGRQKFKI